MGKMIGIDLAGFRILEQIGQGGMAKVYKAYQPGMDRVVALKILPDLYAQDQSAKARFRQEAQIIASLEHPHILPVYDFSEKDETAFLVMRYLQAGNLKNLLAAAPNGRLDLPDAALLTSHIASALDYAHQKGIVHRDVKPANVLIDPHGQAFLTDFGIAKVLEATQELTKTGSTLGTPAYMSPEQASGGDVDHSSDIYSLGIILYQLLTGTPPFEADTPYATIVAHLQEPLPLPSSLNPEIPEAVEQVLLKALARDPENRYSSAGELTAALDQALQEEGIEKAQEKVSPALLNLSGSLAGDRSSEELTIDDQELLKRATWERRRKKLIPWGVGVFLIGILLAVGLILIQNNKNKTEEILLNHQATLDAVNQATMNPTEAAEIIKKATQTAIIHQHATSTQEALHWQATKTILALTPTITPSHTPTPTSTPTPIYVTGDILIQTNFENRSLGNWLLGSPYWFITEDQDGNFVLRSDIDLEQSRGNAYPAEVGSQYWTDYRLEFDLRVSGSGPYEDFNIFFRSAHETNDWCDEYRLIGDYRNITLSRSGYNDPNCPDETWLSEMVPIEFTQNNWHHFEILAYGSELSVSLDQHGIIKINDKQPILNGRIGFAGNAGHIMDIDNIVITELIPRQ